MSVVFAPIQITVLPAMVIAGLVMTLTVLWAEAVQLPVAASTEYTVVTVGVAVTSVAVAELKLPAGDQV